MTETDQLTADLRLQESVYAAAKMRNDHQSAQLAAAEMSRLHHLFLLVQQQELEEAE